MNYEKACEILGITYLPPTMADIKKQYRIKALKCHPDKDLANPLAGQQFQEIYTAYEYLIQYTNGGSCFNNDDDDDNEYDDCQDCFDNEFADYETTTDKSTYRWLLYKFLKSTLAPCSQNRMFYVIIQRVASSCESKALDILSKIDKFTLTKVYDILKLYEDVFHFSDEFKTKLEMLLHNKYKNDECIILNPTIDDLFADNLYKLTVNGIVYIVPLWHHELVYDNSGSDIYVKCSPILPENVRIDSKNNVHVNVTYKIQDIFGKSGVEYTIGKTAVIVVPSSLKLIETQTVTYHQQGVSRINTENVYDVLKRGDIMLHIKLET